MKTLVLIATLFVANAVAAEPRVDDLTRAKDLYEAASYEEALAALDGVTGVTLTDRIHVEQYRALCLIALGRLQEAERAIVALVSADATYVPPPSVASPKVLAIVSDIRKRELPVVVRRLMDEGREAFQRKDLPRARETFELVVKLIDDPTMGGRADVEDLKVIARGFLDLSVATSATSEPPPVPEKTADRNTAAPTSAAASAPASAPSIVPAVIVPAVAIQQAMPPWEPPAAFATVEYKGAIRIVVGTDGKVKSVTIDQRSHPAYDARLVAMASTWLYKPATRNGEPIESERVIPVHLLPPREN